MINIFGLVTSTHGESDSFDKLEVRYYDPDTDPDEPYKIQSVAADGRFDHELEEPVNLNLIVKLFLLERNEDYTLIAFDEIYCDTSELEINFEYNEGLYSYARDLELSINGQVTATESNCISFDKLLVKFYNTYDLSADYFDSVAVDSNGYFTKAIVSPTRGLTIKLVVVNRDASETRVSLKDFYIEVETLDVNFNYTESQYSYAHPDIAITGIVTPAEEPCDSLNRLLVRFFNGDDEDAGHFDSVEVGSDGTFEKDIIPPSVNLLVKLYVTYPDATEAFISSNSYDVAGEPLDVNFDYDESLFGYANISVTINGTVTFPPAGCSRPDVVSIEYYDNFDAEEGEPYTIHYIESDGLFGGEVNLTSRSLVVKLCCIDTTGHRIIFDVFTYFCDSADLNVELYYDETILGYSPSSLSINGLVTPNVTPCDSLDKLVVKLYDGYSGATVPFESFSVNSAGVFGDTVTSPTSKIIAKLFLTKRDATLQLLETVEYNYTGTTGELDIEFDYDESLYEYADILVHIDGIVIPVGECSSLDKLLVEFYDADEPSDPAFDSVNVDSAGIFTKNISSPSANMIVKLFVVNPDATKDLVDSTNCFCPEACSLALEFFYNEDLFYYSKSNTNNMGLNIKGVVVSAAEEYFSCLDTKQLKVRIYEVGFNSLSQVGTDVNVNRNGTFSVNIGSEIDAFLVRLYLNDGGDLFLAAESQRYCHHDAGDIRFEITESKIGRPVLDKLISRLADAGIESLYPEYPLTEMTEDELNQLSCLTCVSVNSIKRLREAYDLWSQIMNYSMEGEYVAASDQMTEFIENEERGVAVFFGLLRFLSTSLQEVFGFSREQFEYNLKYCAGINEIDGSLLSSDYPNWTHLRDLTDLLEGTRNVLLLNSENDGLYYDAKLTHFAELDYRSKNALLDLILSRGGLKGIVEVPDGMEEAVSEARKVAKLGTFLKNHVPFLKHVIDEEEDYDLDYWAIAAGTYDPEHPEYWSDLLEGFSPLPEGFTREEYAALITRSVAAMEPSANMYFHLHGSTITGAEQIRTILENHRGFKIDQHSSARFFTTESGEDTTISGEDMESINRFQRVIRLTKETDGLRLAEGLYTYEAESPDQMDKTTCSSGIVNLGRKTFEKTLKEILLDGGGGMSEVDAQAAASDIWCEAKALNDAAIVTAIHYLRYEKKGSLMPFVLNVQGGTYPGQEDVPGHFPGNMIPDAQELPNMETLFGGFDTCNCTHCQSVYSPAAYLTDLLHWLRKDVKHPDPPNKTGLDALEKQSSIERRRDIRYIKLSCENTNAMLPYIDIVNEILSVNLQTTGLTALYQTLQTTKTTEEIMVEPEHRFKASEDLLYGKKFPWVLPYNVAFDESISVMKLSGKEYHEVIRDFSNSSLKYNSFGWACALLNINPQEAVLLTTGTTGSFWLDYWGSSGAITTLGPVMDVTGFDINGVKDIFDSSYVNSTKVEIEDVDDACDVESYTFDPSFSSAIAERFMKFTRLKRKTSLSTWELDIAIKNLSSSGIDSPFITKLAACVAFTRQYPISFADLMVFYGNNVYVDVFSSTTYSAYYQDKFRNPLLPDAIRNFFSTSPSSSYAANVQALTAEQKQFVSVVLETSVPAIEKIIAHLAATGIITGTPIAFTNTVLAHIHKYCLLIKLFGLDVDKLGRYVGLFGNPFGGNVIKDVWDLSSALSRFSTLGIPLAEFLDLTEGTGIYSLVDLDGDAERIWNFVEKAFQGSREANKDKDATEVGNAGFYTDIVLGALALHFELAEQDTSDLITAYSATWLDNFIDDPDGTGTERKWSNKASDFAPMHQFFYRINTMAKLFGMGKDAIANGLKVEAGTLDVLPAAPFYWLTGTFTALPAPAIINDLLWVKGVSHHAAVLDMLQIDPSPTNPNDVYLLANDYYNNYKANYVAANTGITALYELIGPKSAYKLLSLHEFTEIFIRAQALSISSAPGDIVALLDAFETIYDATQVFNIKATDAWAWVWKEVSSPASTWKPAYPSGPLVQTFTASTLDDTMSNDIRRSVNSMFPVFSAWSNTVVPVQNGLRMRMRDAFVAYYIGYKNGVDANRLYAYFLLDTQMAPCMLTSRIVSAISSVQLLVHRAMLGLEQDIYIDEINKQEWEWRKNYRVWEANRKVFLYPENWIEPALRKNKTLLFKEAEELLQQDEFNDRNAELAYAGYLTGLNEVSNLDVRAVYVEDPAADLTNHGAMRYNNTRQEIFHVFARNWNPPYYYYYRTYSRGVWTGWEKLDVEINSDHLIPCMFNRRLYLFFPVFVEKIYKQEVDSSSGKDVLKNEVKYFEVQMCYTKFDFGKWSQKKVLDGTLYAGPRAGIEFSNDNGPGLGARCGFSGANFNKQKDLSYDLKKSDGFNEYAFVSMKKEDFYFWTQLMPEGDLIIHCRRAHEGKKTVDKYTQFAYEWGFKISAMNERVEIIQPIISEGNNTALRYLSRPSMTVPYNQQMKYGRDSTSGPDQNLYVKDTVSAASVILDTSLLTYVDKYTLTYPQQFKHNTAKQPFFFMHPLRNYFFLFNRSVPVLRDMSTTNDPVGGA